MQGNLNTEFEKLITTPERYKAIGLTPQQVANIRQNGRRKAISIEKKIQLLELEGAEIKITVSIKK